MKTKWLHPLTALFITCFAVFTISSPFVAVGQDAAPFRVYLAFEDGPTSAYTPGILDTLAEFHARASFVISGAQISGHESLIQREVREGHALVNHLWNEPGVYAGAPAEAVIDSYQRTEAALREALGPDLLPIYDQQVKLFWQPGGAAQPFPASGDIHVITYNWNVNSDDCGWAMPATVDLNTYAFDAAVLANVLGDPVLTGSFHSPYGTFDYGDGVVITFHDLNRVTGRVLPTILAELSAAGAVFLPLPRTGDVLDTMPIALGTAPDWSRAGVAGYRLAVTVDSPEGAMLRSGPGTEYSVGGTVDDGAALTAIGRSGDWLLIETADVPLWIWRGLVTLHGPFPHLPQV